MKNDIQPSLICALFTTNKAFKNFKKEMKNQKLNYREIKLIDIGIPLENLEYEKTTSFLKRFTKPILARFLNYIPFKSLIFKSLSKHNLEPFDYDNFKQEADYKHPLSFLGFTPLFIDTKYKEHYSKEEKENLEKLKTLSNNTFKPTPLKEQGIIEENEMEMIDNENL